MKYVGLLNGFFWSWGIAFPMIILGIFYCPNSEKAAQKAV